MEEMLDIVDENDNVIGRASRDEAHEGLIHRIVHVLVFNDRGEMALQLRSKRVSYLSGYWATSAGGHVISGESYEQAAIRELKEELGLTAKLEFFSKDLYKADNKPKFLMVFKARSNGPFRFIDKSVEKIQFFALPEIQKMVERKEKMHPELLFLLKKYFRVRL